MTEDATGGDTAETEHADPQPGGEARLEELRSRLEHLDEIPLEERPALFEELNRRISDELAALEEV